MHRIPIVPFLPKRNLLTHFQTPPPNPNVSSPFHSHNTGLSTTLGRHLILINCPLFPTCLASKATPNGGPMRWTQGLGIPRCAYEFNRSARYDVDGIRFTGRTALRCLEMEGNEEFESQRSRRELTETKELTDNDRRVRWIVLMAEPPKAFATRRQGESHGVGTWRMLARVARVKNPV